MHRLEITAPVGWALNTNNELTWICFQLVLENKQQQQNTSFYLKNLWQRLKKSHAFPVMSLRGTLKAVPILCQCRSVLLLDTGRPCCLKMEHWDASCLCSCFLQVTKHCIAVVHSSSCLSVPVSFMTKHRVAVVHAISCLAVPVSFK